MTEVTGTWSLVEGRLSVVAESEGLFVGEEGEERPRPSRRHLWPVWLSELGVLRLDLDGALAFAKEPALSRHRERALAFYE